MFEKRYYRKTKKSKNKRRRIRKRKSKVKNRNRTTKKRLLCERSWSKKGIHFYKQQEFRIIEELSKTYSVNYLCKMMDINRSSYYKWIKRQNTPSYRMIQRETDINVIREIHEKHPSHGYRWINSFLRNHYGVVMSNNHVHLCCKYAGIISQGKHYKYVKPGEEKRIYPNLVGRKWKYLTKPLEVIVSDMTCFYVKGNYYELTFYFDAFTKEILSYSLTTRRGDTKQYYDGLEDVINLIKNEECTEPTILHTDQGSVYSSLSYNELIKNYNIKRSISRAGTPTDNPVNESLNGWIKEELFLDFNLKQSDNVEQAIKDYVYYFNNDRPAYSLKYKTPNQFKTELGLNSTFL